MISIVKQPNMVTQFSCHIHLKPQELVTWAVVTYAANSLREKQSDGCVKVESRLTDITYAPESSRSLIYPICCRFFSSLAQRKAALQAAF